MDLDHLQALLGDTSDSEFLAPEETAGFSDIWVIGEAVDGKLTQLTAQLLGAARELANELGAYVRAGLPGNDLGELGSSLIALGADVAHLADHPVLENLAAEPVLTILKDWFQEFKPAAALFPSGVLGDQIAPRLAQSLNATLTTQCIALRPDLSTRAITAEYAVYDGEYYESRTIRPDGDANPSNTTQMFTILPNAFRTPEPDPYRQGAVQHHDVDLTNSQPRIRPAGPVEYSRPPLAIDRAGRILAIGYELGEANVPLAKDVAAKLGAQIAGERAAAAAGWIDYNQVVGLMGYNVAPDFYLSLGVRGGAEHNIGLERARFIAAVHPDPTAPIFDIADLCIVAEPDKVLSLLQHMI